MVIRLSVFRLILVGTLLANVALGQDRTDIRVRRTRNRPIKEAEILFQKRISPSERSKEVGVIGAPDSLRWWDQRAEGFSRWSLERKKYPRAKSIELEMFLVDLGTEVREMIGVPAPRINVFVADTLNPSVWPLGGGFIYLSAGLLHRVSDEKEFTFLMALEMAHEALRHPLWPKQAELEQIRGERERARVAAIERAKKEAEERDADGPREKPDSSDLKPVLVDENPPNVIVPTSFWAVFVDADPLDEFGLQYDVQQEVEALGIVAKIFQKRDWDWRLAGKNVVKILNGVSSQVSSIRHLHEHLDKAISQPIWRRRQSLPVEPNRKLVGTDSFERLQRELRETSVNSLQHNPWLLQIVANYSPEEFSALKNDSDVLASLYLQVQASFAKEDWEQVLVKSEQALEMEPKSEPFLWHKGLARLQLEKFGMCQTENWEQWISFDYLREVLFMECLFLDGRYSDSQRQAIEHRKKYPLDIRGAYWDVLSQIRMRLNVERRLKEMELFWGERPAVLALRVLDLMYRTKREELEKIFSQYEPNSSKFSVYDPEEVGMYDFARAWAHHQLGRSMGVQPTGKIEADLRGAEGRWAIARLVRLNLPRLMN